MMHLDFDTPIDRRGTQSYKWDGTLAEFGREDGDPHVGGGYGLSLRP